MSGYSCNKNKLVLKGFGENLCRAKIQSIIETGFGGLGGGAKIVCSDCETVAYVYMPSEEGAKAIVERFRTTGICYKDEAKGEIVKVRVQGDKPIDIRRHARVIGKIRECLEILFKDSDPKVAFSSNGFHGKIIANFAYGSMMHLMTVSKVAASGSVSVHVMDCDVGRLGITAEVLTKAGEDGVVAADLKPLQG